MIIGLVQQWQLWQKNSLQNWLASQQDQAIAPHQRRPNHASTAKTGGEGKRGEKVFAIIPQLLHFPQCASGEGEGLSALRSTLAVWTNHF